MLVENLTMLSLTAQGGQKRGSDKIFLDHELTICEHANSRATQIARYFVAHRLDVPLEPGMRIAGVCCARMGSIKMLLGAKQ